MMNDTVFQSRGYDDKPFLKEMASGLVVRRYSSVDEAAKAVTGETGGSNVDRLRRKFREQNWYETGLKEYVEGEIQRRSGKAEETGRDHPVISARFAHKGREYIGLKAIALSSGIWLENAVTPSAIQLLASIGVALVCVLALLGAIQPLVPACAAGVVAFLLACVWTKTAASKATENVGTAHVCLILALGAATAYAFSLIVPDPTMTFGSVPGSISIALSMSLAGLYGSTAVLAKATRGGVKPTVESMALGMLIAWLSTVGGFVSATDMSAAQRRTDVGIEAWNRMYGALVETKDNNPGIDFGKLKAVQIKAMNTAIGKADLPTRPSSPGH